jgi:hypothetical protein
VLAGYRLERVPAGRVAGVLSAWSITGGLTVAALTALGWPVPAARAR